MAGNEWLNGYLEAILDAGSGRSNNGSREEEESKINKTTSLRKRFDEKLKFGKFEAQKEKEGKLFSPTKYFVEEVVNSFDESDLYRTWIKVSLSLFPSLTCTHKERTLILEYLTIVFEFLISDSWHLKDIYRK